jgi:HEAT repeat protein
MAYTIGIYSLLRIFHKLYALKTEGMGGNPAKNIPEIDDKARPDRWQSVVALEKKGKPTLEYLVSALEDEVNWVRYAAAEVLGISVSGAVSTTSLVHCRTPVMTKICSYGSLGKLGNPKTCSIQNATCRKDNRMVNIAAEKVLMRIYH